MTCFSQPVAQTSPSPLLSHCVGADSNYSPSGCVSRATKKEQHGCLSKVDRGHSVHR